MSKPVLPAKYTDFIAKYPELGAVWDALHAAEAKGPLDARMQRLLKFAVAIGAQKSGAGKAAVRKALDAGLTEAELGQVVVLAASTVGLPGAVAAHGWIQDVLQKD